MTIILKVNNYGLYVFWNEFDMNTDTRHNWGYKLWWKNVTPRIEETLRITKWGDHGGFTWELLKNGKKFDGLTVQGPLVRFEKA